jgi:uncharacterized damage-inducible protein DinB
LRQTVRDLTNEQAAQRTTASALSLSVLIKHVAEGESSWVDFILEGPRAIGDFEDSLEKYQSHWTLAPGETLAGVLDHYEQVADRTDGLVSTIDLDASHPLPLAPWFEVGGRWTARRVLLHVIAETAQHAGHADIIRESLDGAKTMG